MWSQRIFGMEYAFSQPDHAPYLLVCDDDVEFGESFAAELVEMCSQNDLDLLIPIKNYHAPLRKRIISRILGERTENRKSPYKITIKANARFTVNNTLPNNLNPTQSGPFQCFIMRTDITPSLLLRDEMWLDETRYALPDDQVFFYKAHLLGFRVYSCKSPEFKHLDGKAGVSDRQRELDSIYSGTRNMEIFYRRFVMPNRKGILNRIKMRLSHTHYTFMKGLATLIRSAMNRDLELYSTYRKAWRAAQAFNRPFQPDPNRKP